MVEIDPDKTQILTNQKSNKLKEIKIDGMHVEILPPEGKAKHLGQMIHRMRCAWSAFARH